MALTTVFGTAPTALLGVEMARPPPHVLPVTSRATMGPPFSGVIERDSALDDEPQYTHLAGSVGIAVFPTGILPQLQLAAHTAGSLRDRVREAEYEKYRLRRDLLGPLNLILTYLRKKYPYHSWRPAREAVEKYLDEIDDLLDKLDEEIFAALGKLPAPPTGQPYQTSEEITKRIDALLAAVKNLLRTIGWYRERLELLLQLWHQFAISLYGWERYLAEAQAVPPKRGVPSPYDEKRLPPSPPPQAPPWGEEDSSPGVVAGVLDGLIRCFQEIREQLYQINRRESPTQDPVKAATLESMRKEKRDLLKAAEQAVRALVATPSPLEFGSQLENAKGALLILEARIDKNNRELASLDSSSGSTRPK